MLTLAQENSGSRRGKTPKYERAKKFTEGELRSLADIFRDAADRIVDEADVMKDDRIDDVKVLHGTGITSIVEEKLPDFLADLAKKVRKAAKVRKKIRRRRE